MGFPGRTEPAFHRFCLVDRNHRDRGHAAARSRYATPNAGRTGRRSRAVDGCGHCRHADHGPTDVFGRRAQLLLQSLASIQDGIPDRGPAIPLHAARAGGASGRISDCSKAGRRDVPSALDHGHSRRPNDRVHLSPFMTHPALLVWIESTQSSTAIREGGLPYPVIGGIHLLAIALFGGMLLVTDLRLLGLVMRRRPFSEVWYQFRPWKQFGFVVVTVTGLLIAWSEPIRLYNSPSFWVKMALLAGVGV